MKISEDKELFTNNGWEKLRGRLDKDGLLQGGSGVTSNRKTLPSHRRIITVAAAAAACIVVAAVILLRAADDRPLTLYTLTNSRSAPTMVQTLADGSVVYLAAGAEISMPEKFATDKREVAMSGRVYFEVEGNRERPFLIDAGIATVEVVGTRFDVCTDDNGFSVSVDSGEVRVHGNNGEGSITLHTGETAVITAGRFKKEEIAYEPAFARYIGYINFKDHPLEDVIRKINDIFPDTEIRLSEDISDRAITVTFRNDGPKRMVELICLALDLEYNYEENIVYITGHGQ